MKKNEKNVDSNLISGLKSFVVPRVRLCFQLNRKTNEIRQNVYISFVATNVSNMENELRHLVCGTRLCSSGTTNCAHH